jgi:hypothetical protein
MPGKILVKVGTYLPRNAIISGLGGDEESP